jgi:heme/copper-type cytochrome/quinol oxidase subunit 2
MVDVDAASEYCSASTSHRLTGTRVSNGHGRHGSWADNAPDFGMSVLRIGALPPQSTRRSLMGVAIVLVLLVAASVLFHFLSPWYFTPIASNWGTIDDTISITFWVTGAVFVIVNLFMAYAVYRYRHRTGGRAHYEPENKKLEWWLLGLTTVGVAAMLAPGLFVWAKFVDVPKDAMVVEALGQQWHWMYRFPGKDGKLGTVDAKYVSNDNPFGMNPGDPSGQDDVLIANPEVHLPLGKPIKVLLRSKDVLHNFTVTQFRVKMDLVTGMITHLWLTPTVPGEYEILCEELCGIGHFAMRGRVVVAGGGIRPGSRTADVRSGTGASRSGRRAGAVRHLRGLPRRRGRGQPRAECTQAGRTRRLVPQAATGALQARCPRDARQGCLWQGHGADGDDTGRCRRDRRRVRIHRIAAGQAGSSHREGQCAEG